MIITKDASAIQPVIGSTASAGRAAAPAAGGAAGTTGSGIAGTAGAAGGAGAAAAAATTGVAGTGQSAADQSDRFLKLLVAQMRNQDPLNPLDNAAVTTQMAQISTVEGVEKLNATLTQYLNRGNALSSLDGASLIGRRVLVKGDGIDLGKQAADGTRSPAQGGFELSAAAPKVTIEILDATGAVIASQQQTGLSAGVHRFDWDGTTGAGAPAAAGSYKFRVRGDTADAALPVTTLQARPVTAVISGTDGPRLEIGGNSQLTVADVRAILQENTK